MTDQPAAPPTDDDDLLLGAYLDGELDAAAALALERRLEASLDLSARLDRLAALRARIQAIAPRTPASAAFHTRIAAMAAEPAPQTVNPARRFDWRALAASALLAFGLGNAAMLYATRPDPAADDLRTVVAGHRRALLAASAVDVVSTDQHTVKPWFDGRLAVAPTIADLAGAGFKLEGGRIDIVAGEAVPTLVYRRREHLISLVEQPRSGRAQAFAGAETTAQNGYRVVSWQDGAFTFRAVSDIAEAELAEFVAAFIKTARTPVGP